MLEAVKRRERGARGAPVKGIVVAMAIIGMTPVPAHAYSHEWSCFNPAYDRCWDTAGQFYNPWVYHTESVPSGTNGTCAKAETAAGNTKSGSGCDGDNYRASSYAASPTSWAYGYHGDGGCGCTWRTIYGQAYT